MAEESPSDAFLRGQEIPVDPRAIEEELTRLWGPAAERLGGPELEHPNVTRIVLANLVVAGPADDGGRLEAALDTVSARFPCRAILLKRTREPGRRLTAEVSALCHLPAPGLPQVCSERIVLAAGPDASDLWPGAVRPLLEADLPFVLWWADDPRNAPGAFGELAAECSRLILDLPDPAAEPAALRFGLDPARHASTRDTAWLGIARWRELVAQFFDPPDHQADLARVAAVEVLAAAATVERSPRAAAWLVAWLAGQLGWNAVGTLRQAPGRLDATFQGPGGPVAATIRTEVDPGADPAQIRGVALTTQGPDPWTFRLERAAPGSPDVRIAIATSGSCPLPRTVNSPELDLARRVAAGLESARLDPPARAALPHAMWLMDC